MKRTISALTAVILSAVIISGCSQPLDKAAEHESGEKTAVSEVPVNSEAISESVEIAADEKGFVFPEYKNKGIYDNQLMEIQRGIQGPTESYEELMADETENSNIESLYKIKVSRVLDDEEAKQLAGWSKGRGDHNCVFYEGIALYDYLNRKEVNKTVIFRMPGTLQSQRENQPPYAPKDIIAAVLQKKEEDSDITRLFKSYAFIYDVFEVNGEDFLAVRGQNEDKLEEGLDNLLAEKKTRVITTVTDNPAVYFGVYRAGDLSEKLAGLWKTVIKQ